MKAESSRTYRSSYMPTWCKGCSYFGVLDALTDIFARRQIAPHGLSVVSGIGCSSRIPLFLNTFGVHTLHGRALPVATGCRLVRPDIPVVVIAGDGDLFSIGMSHFVHAARRNLHCMVVCLDNRMYAMTKNQASATSPLGHSGTLTPVGENSSPLNVVELAITCKATFVSRTFAGAPEHLRETFSQAFDHHGFSFVHVVAPCRTFGHTALADLSPRVVDINRTGNHDPANLPAALQEAMHALDYDRSETEKIPVGIFWKTSLPTFDGQMAERRLPHEKRRPFSSIIDDFSA